MIYMSLYVHLFEYYLLIVNSINLNNKVLFKWVTDESSGQLSQTLIKLGQCLTKRVKPLITLKPWFGLDTRGVHSNLSPFYLCIFMHLGYLSSTYTYYLFG
jgi:hypothetical protein